MAGNLSGGEQQMLALGMAFIAKPKLLMIDELSLGLAPTIVEQLLGIVRRIQESGTAIVLVEQSINVALTVADRAYFLEKGEVRFEGPTEELLERDDIVRSVFLEGAGSVQRRRPERRRPRPTPGARAPPTELEPILELDGVDQALRRHHAPSTTPASCSTEGEILGLIGPNGAGKTTIFDLISGFLVARPAAASRFDGDDVTEHEPRQAGVARARPLVPGRPARPVAHRRREHRHRARAPPRRARPPGLDAQPARRRRARRRTSRGPSPTSSSS